MWISSIKFGATKKILGKPVNPSRTGVKIYGLITCCYISVRQVLLFVDVLLFESQKKWCPVAIEIGLVK
jgi:hypothetical protein